MYMMFRFNVMYVYLSKDGSKALSYIIIKKYINPCCNPCYISKPGKQCITSKGVTIP